MGLIELNQSSFIFPKLFDLLFLISIKIATLLTVAKTYNLEASPHKVLHPGFRL